MTAPDPGGAVPGIADLGSIRAATPGDLPAVLGLMRTCLGWPQDQRAEALWRWKHEANPAGASFVWVGVSGGEVVAVRAFLRWRLSAADGSLVSAVRAVDTATRADHQGRGWFRRLTQHGLETLHGEGIDVVFNTPNDASRPGYLSMGWQEQGRLPTAIRVGRLAGLSRLARARVPADLWPDGLPEARGLGVLTVDEAFGTTFGADNSSPPIAGPDGWSTVKDAAFLRWRYGLEPLGYRVLTDPSGLAAGYVVVRRRRRGGARELAVLDVGGADGARLAGRVVRTVADVDHAVALGQRLGRSWLPLPGQGPRLVARSVGIRALPPHWNLTLGDVELL